MSDLDKTISVNVLDISKFQGSNINFKQLKADGIYGVILRVNDPDNPISKDPCFERNYYDAVAAGLHVGCYWFVQAVTMDFAKQELTKCLEFIKGKKFDLPIYFDIERSEQFKLGSSFCTSLVKYLCLTAQNAGYFVGVYCSTYYYTKYVSADVRNTYACWIADWRHSCGYTGQYGMWQYGTIKTKGINNGNTDVDANKLYVNYPVAIKDRGLNGYTKKGQNRYKANKQCCIIKGNSNKPDVYGPYSAGAQWTIDKIATIGNIKYGHIYNSGNWVDMRDVEEV